MAKADAGSSPDPASIRPSMRDRVAHTFHPGSIDRLGGLTMKDTGDPAHMRLR